MHFYSASRKIAQEVEALSSTHSLRITCRDSRSFNNYILVRIKLTVTIFIYIDDTGDSPLSSTRKVQVDAL